MVRPAGFEPATSCSGGTHSIHLSYGRTGLQVQDTRNRDWLDTTCWCDHVDMPTTVPMALTRQRVVLQVNRAEMMLIESKAKEAGMTVPNYFRSLAGLPRYQQADRPARRWRRSRIARGRSCTRWASTLRRSSPLTSPGWTIIGDAERGRTNNDFPIDNPLATRGKSNDRAYYVGTTRSGDRGVACGPARGMPVIRDWCSRSNQPVIAVLPRRSRSSRKHGLQVVPHVLRLVLQGHVSHIAHTVERSLRIGVKLRE
jgi:hypothetical protein